MLALVLVAAFADDVPSKLQKIGKDEKKIYDLIGDDKSAAAPKDGYGLVVVMPGGDGSAEFHPFVERLGKDAFPKGYLAVQPIAVKWDAKQDKVCPYRMAAEAKAALSEAGATVKLETYDGGHGWQGDTNADVKAGLQWLEANRPKK